MNHTIYKYRIPGVGRVQRSMPKGAKCLCVNEQGGTTFVWALVDPAAEPEIRTFLAVETGVPDVPPDSRYLGTALLEGGQYVLHIFELEKLAE